MTFWIVLASFWAINGLVAVAMIVAATRRARVDQIADSFWADRTFAWWQLLGISIAGGSWTALLWWIERHWG